MRAVDSPIKRTNEFGFFLPWRVKKQKKKNSFVRWFFLGESTARQSAYGFIWPLTVRQLGSDHKNKFHATHLNWIQAVNIKILSYYLGIWLCPRCLLAAGKHWMQTIYALEEKREGKIVVYKVGKKDCEKFSSLQYTFY